MCPFYKKKLRIKNVKFFVLQSYFWFIFQIVLKNVPHFHDFFNSKKCFEIVIIISTKLKKTIIFEKAFNSNFTYGIRVIFKHVKALEELKSTPLYILTNLNSRTLLDNYYPCPIMIISFAYIFHALNVTIIIG